MWWRLRNVHVLLHVRAIGDSPVSLAMTHVRWLHGQGGRASTGFATLSAKEKTAGEHADSTSDLKLKLAFLPEKFGASDDFVINADETWCRLLPTANRERPQFATPRTQAARVTLIMSPSMGRRTRCTRLAQFRGTCACATRRTIGKPTRRCPS